MTNPIRFLLAMVNRWHTLHKALVATAVVASLLVASLAAGGFGPAPAAASDEADQEHAAATWIVRWQGAPDPAFYADSDIRAEYPQTGVTVASPRMGRKTQDWLDRWEHAPSVASFEPNQTARIAQAPNDPMLVNQRYLELIHAQEAWDQAVPTAGLTIALVDTGVDLTHPDLQDQLVEGTNLITPGRPPSDDNGHGTAVAGVIAAAANNDIGIAGIAWKAKIMPIKALEADGTGQEDKLGEGIRYAVDHGAAIVVLSLGLNKYSAYMKEIVDYAERKGVLLVAASGNEGSAVKYPAAYPTVLAVGGATRQKSADDRSNFGSELDVIAPWDVFTTAPDGKYVQKDGTSMAAPQVAAVCALLLGRSPELAPYQVRSIIRRTAEDVGPAGWDAHNGYGLLRADRAVAAEYAADRFESNDVQSAAKPLPIGKMADAELSGGADNDWYALEAAYNGTLTFHVAAVDALDGQIELMYVAADGQQTTWTSGLADGVTVQAAKGISYIRLRLADKTGTRTIGYKLTALEGIYADPYESNDRMFLAYGLPDRSQTITGTFDHMDDQDWYMINLSQFGTLKLKVNVNTPRMDPVLLVQRKGEKATTIDQKGDGNPETSLPIDVQPGVYYIRVSNLDDYHYPVLGEYTLDIEYLTKMTDPNEPNDRSFQATPIQLGENYFGVLDPKEDVDWYRFKLDAESIVDVSMSGLQAGIATNFSLYDNALQPAFGGTLSLKQASYEGTFRLAAGTYYAKLAATQGDPYSMYRLNVNASRLVAGFRDIAGHWAEQPIAALVAKGIVDGFGNFRFEPDWPVTRAEAAAMLVRGFEYGNGTSQPFRDVPASHWAAAAIAKTASAGVMTGYSDGTFGPDRGLTRIEMASIFARVLQLDGNHAAEAKPTPFVDVPFDYWGAGLLNELYDNRMIEGYEDGTFRPDSLVTRAAFSAMLSRALNR
ncbi:MAG: S8 family serine peptidase [Paenibacillaceae bacterium]|nr:S8 family serine peptidase [Paenibacillaceae bacterium]